VRYLLNITIVNAMILEKFSVSPHGILLEFDKSFSKMTTVVHTSGECNLPGCHSLKKETVTVNYTNPKKILFIPTGHADVSTFIKVEIVEIDSQNHRNDSLAYLFSCAATATANDNASEPMIKSDLIGAALMSEGVATLLQRGFS
jgi:hypothetical protein